MNDNNGVVLKTQPLLPNSPLPWSVLRTMPTANTAILRRVYIGGPRAHNPIGCILEVFITNQKTNATVTFSLFTEQPNPHS
jgi:hypothetical protein